MSDTTARASDDPRLTQIMLRKDLVARGWTDRALAAQVRGGALAKARRGAYVDAWAWGALDARGRHEVTARAVVQQAATEVVLSHHSGLLVWDAPTWGLDLGDVHVTRVDGRAGRREAGVCQHRGVILDGDVVRQHDVQVMSPTRLALETTMLTGVEQALVVVNDLLHRGLTTPEALDHRVAQGMEQWAGSAATNVVVRLANARIESVGESRTLFMLWMFGQGIPLPQFNYEIKDRHGRVLYRVDFAWPELGVFMEFDGKEKYLKFRRPGESVVDAVLREKRRQEAIERHMNWRCIRIIWADLNRPQQTVAMIRAVLARVAAA